LIYCCCSSSNALSLLKGLLVRDPAQRLGSGPDGVAAIKRHAFFKGLSWSKLEARQLESKFKPGVKCSMVSVARQLVFGVLGGVVLVQWMLRSLGFVA
jgi:hypothetical protein